MLLRDTPVASVMTSDVVAFSPDDNVGDATRRLVERAIDAGPVTDDEGRVVGMLSTGDLIVQESRLHVPTVISILGATIELPGEARRFERDLEQALGATVGKVMTPDPITCGPDDTVETAATAMHTHNVSRLPVVDADGRLVGLIARGDVVRAIVDAGDGPLDGPSTAAPSAGDAAADSTNG
ncbi:MAG: CBS domain-containing protein [Acidimicrobiia bacterium]|nr:CBS domain-containing protein [Acidimicrobiia bacterium]